MNAFLSELSKWLAATSLSHTIQTAGWIIPTLQTVHILCVAVVFASAMLVDFRMFRLFEREVPLQQVMRRFLPAIWPVLVILLLTGSLTNVLIAERADRMGARLTFAEHARAGVPIAIISIGFAVFWLALMQTLPVLPER